MNTAIATILDAGGADGSLRAEVQPAKRLREHGRHMLAAADTDQAARVLQLLVDALVTRDFS